MKKDKSKGPQTASPRLKKPWLKLKVFTPNLVPLKNACFALLEGNPLFSLMHSTFSSLAVLFCPVRPTIILLALLGTGLLMIAAVLAVPGVIGTTDEHFAASNTPALADTTYVASALSGVPAVSSQPLGVLALS